MNEKSKIDFAQASLKFFLISIGVVLIALLLAWIIIAMRGEFTLWAIVPLLAGFPLTIFININIAKKTMNNSRSDISQKGPADEKTE